MTPTEYQKGKYKSLLKELPDLEKQAAKKGWKWAITGGVLMAVLNFLGDYLIGRSAEISFSEWVSSYKRLTILTSALVWTLIIYFLDVKGVKSEAKRKRKELEDLKSRFPRLKEEPVHHSPEVKSKLEKTAS